MMDDPASKPCSEFPEKLTSPQGIPSEKLSSTSPMSAAALAAMSVSELTEHCLREMSNYRKREPSNEHYGLELFRRATVDCDQEAWRGLQVCFSDVVSSWIRRHPQREVACCRDSEENYVAQAFERFWLATSCKRKVEFSTLATALQYLRASLNSAILDNLRTYAQAREVPLPEPGSPGEPSVEDAIDTGELWELLQKMLPHKRDQRLAYLLYHCGLKPREIIRYCPQEFNDVREIYRAQRKIIERLLRNADQLRWLLGSAPPRVPARGTPTMIQLGRDGGS